MAPCRYLRYPMTSQKRTGLILFRQKNAIHDVFQGVCLSLRRVLTVTTDQGTKQSYITVSLNEIQLS